MTTDKLTHVILEQLEKMPLHHASPNVLHRIVPVQVIGQHTFITSTNEEFSCRTGKRLNGPDGGYGQWSDWRACGHLELENLLSSRSINSIGFEKSLVPSYDHHIPLCKLRPDNFSVFCYRHGISDLSKVLKFPLDIVPRNRLV